MENLRKRLHKEKIEMNRFAVDNVLTEVLMPIDNFENALGFTENMSAETKNWATGFEMILNQFKDVLAHYNVKPFSSKGELFDPHRHEAVEIEETDDLPEGTITQELLKGYQSQERILRAARVKVAKHPSVKKQEKEEE
jgi:molecular chaperone GrpE